MWVPIVAAIGAVLGHDTGSSAPTAPGGSASTMPMTSVTAGASLAGLVVIAVDRRVSLSDSGHRCDRGPEIDRPDTLLPACCWPRSLIHRHQSFDRDVGGRIRSTAGWPRTWQRLAAANG